MANTLSDFPPDRFAITTYCPCGHSAPIDYRDFQVRPVLLKKSALSAERKTNLQDSFVRQEFSRWSPSNRTVVRPK